MVAKMNEHKEANLFKNSGYKKVRNNSDQKQAALKKKVEKRRARKKFAKKWAD